MRYQDVIFDLDGTLTDSAEGILNSAEYAFEQLGIPLPGREKMRMMVGPPLAYSFPRLGAPPELVDEVIRLYRYRYNDLGGKFENRVYPGVEEMLGKLRRSGLRLLLGTSKPELFAREILDRFSLSQHFSCIAGATLDRSRENKSDVLRYLLSFADPAGRAVMVGDTRYDVEGAHELGIPCVGVTWGYGPLEELESAGADAIVNSPAELLAYLTADEQTA